MKEKIALFCDVDVEAVITARDVKIGLRSALVFAEAKAWTRSCCAAALDAAAARPDRWTAMLERMQNPRDEVTSAWWASTWSTRIPTRA
jgi:CTP synthase (UTP-ammonia lyase)